MNGDGGDQFHGEPEEDDLPAGMSQVANAYLHAMRVVIAGGLCSLIVIDDELYIATGVCQDMAAIQQVMNEDDDVRARFAVGLAIAQRARLEAIIAER
jgi:hypothetical protein